MNIFTQSFCKHKSSFFQSTISSFSHLKEFNSNFIHGLQLSTYKVTLMRDGCSIFSFPVNPIIRDYIACLHGTIHRSAMDQLTNLKQKYILSKRSCTLAFCSLLLTLTHLVNTRICKPIEIYTFYHISTEVYICTLKLKGKDKEQERPEGER